MKGTELLKEIAGAIGAVATLAGMALGVWRWGKRLAEAREHREAMIAAASAIPGLREEIAALRADLAQSRAGSTETAEALRRLSDEVAWSRELLGQVMDFQDEALWATDTAGFCIRVNESWEQLFGMSRARALGLGWRGGVHPEDVTPTSDSWNACVAARSVWNWQYRVVNGETGKTIPCHAEARPVFAADGRMLGYVGVTRPQEPAARRADP